MREIPGKGIVVGTVERRISNTFVFWNVYGEVAGEEGGLRPMII